MAELVKRVDGELDEVLSRQQWSLVLWGFRRFFSPSILFQALVSSSAQVTDVSKWLVRWIQQCPEDFTRDPVLREKVLAQLSEDAVLIMRSYIRVETQDWCSFLQIGMDPVTSLDTVRAASELVLTFSSDQLAEACMIASRRVFLSMDPGDLQAASISAFFNRLSWGVSSLILAARSSSKQLAIMSLLIDTASKCCALYDFTSFLALTTGLTCHVIERTRAHEYLGQADRTTLQELSQLCMPVGNYKTIRAMEQDGRAKGASVVPMVPIHLRDITAVQELAERTDEMGRFSFSHLVRLGEEIGLLLEFQDGLKSESLELSELVVLLGGLPFLSESERDTLSDKWKDEPRKKTTSTGWKKSKRKSLLLDARSNLSPQPTRMAEHLIRSPSLSALGEGGGSTSGEETDSAVAQSPATSGEGGPRLFARRSETFSGTGSANPSPPSLIARKTSGNRRVLTRKGLGESSPNILGAGNTERDKRRSVSETGSLQAIAAFGAPTIHDSAFPGVRVFHEQSPESSSPPPDTRPVIPRSRSLIHGINVELRGMSRSEDGSGESSRASSRGSSRGGSGKKKHANAEKSDSGNSSREGSGKMRNPNALKEECLIQ